MFKRNKLIFHRTEIVQQIVTSRFFAFPEVRLLSRSISTRSFDWDRYSSLLDIKSGESRSKILQEGVIARARGANMYSPIREKEAVAVAVANDPHNYNNFGLDKDSHLVKRRGAVLRLNVNYPDDKSKKRGK